jgi:ribosomal protein L31
MSIDTGVIESMVSDHMDDQPYQVTCSECGNSLDFSATVDRDLDLKLEVEVCTNCTDCSNCVDSAGRRR